MRKRYLLIGLLALLLVVAITAAACGGTTTTTTASGAATTAAPSTDTTGVASTETTAAPSTETTVAGTPATGEPIKIGFLNDLTGSAAPLAKTFGQGAQLQVDYVNSHGGIGGRPLALTTLDTKADVPTAIAAMNKLVKDDKVSMVIGPFAPFEAEPVWAIADQTKTPTLTAGGSTLQQIQSQSQHQWAFGLSPGPITQGDAVLQLIQLNGWKKIACVQDALGLDQDIVSYLKQKESANLSVIVLPDIIQFTTTDYQPILNKIMQVVNTEKPDAIFLSTVVIHNPALYKGLRDLGVTLPILLGAGASHPAVFAMGPAAVEGALTLDAGGGIVNAPALPDDWPLKAGQLDFSQRYQAKYNDAPDFAAAEGADLVNVAVAAMKQAGGDDKAKVQQALINLKDFVGVEGIVTFSPQLTAEGVHGQMVVWQIKDGKFTYVTSTK